MLSYLREVELFGLTGEIKFDADGLRTDFQLDLMEKHRYICNLILRRNTGTYAT
jgi:hypothetical protein